METLETYLEQFRGDEQVQAVDPTGPCELCGLVVTEGVDGFIVDENPAVVLFIHYDCPGDDNYSADEE